MNGTDFHLNGGREGLTVTSHLMILHILPNIHGLRNIRGHVHAVGEQISSTDFNYISCEDCLIPSDKILIKARK